MKALFAGFLMTAAVIVLGCSAGNNGGVVSPSAVIAQDIGAVGPLGLTKRGNGRGNNDSSLTPVIVHDWDNNGVISHGDAITFNVQTDEYWQQVNVECSQNGVVVFGAARAQVNFYEFTLSSASWTSGPATCTAELIQSLQHKPLASVDFASQ